MRIDCEQCHAAFTIDDALISERGVRAQCPKCGHQKVVKKAAEAAPPPSPAPSANPFAGLSAPAGNPFGAPAAAPAANPFASAGPPPANPFSATAPNPFGAPAPSANPFAAAAAPAPSANPFAGAPAPSANPFAGAPAPSANPFGGGGAANPFAPPSAAAPSANPFAGAPAPSANPFAGAPAPSANPFAGAPAPSANPFASASPFAASPPPPSANPFGASPFGAAAAGGADPFAKPANDPFSRPAAAADPFANVGGATAPDPFSRPSQPSSSSPFGSSAPSADPFANLGGVGDSQRPREASDPFAKAPPKNDDPFARISVDNDGPSTGTGSGGGTGSGSGGAPMGAMPTSSPGLWTVKTATGEETLEIGELRERVKSGAVSLDDKAGPVGEALKAIRDIPQFAPPKIEKAKVSGARAAGVSFSVPRPVAMALGVVAVLGASVFVVHTVKPELFERRSEAGVNPLRRAKPLWQRQFPDVDGTAQEHLVEGRKQMRLDTAAGYRKADEELRQALLLDIGSVEATAAWAENFAQLPTVRADLEGSTLAKEALEYALKREPENVDVMRAQGAIKLALGEVDEAQRILGKALKIAPKDVATQLILAKSNLERNPQDALNLIQREVRATDPDMKAAYVVEGAAQRRLGAFKEAREMLEARLVTDPQNVSALKEIAKLELDLGHADAALNALGKLLEAEDKDVEAHLLRAKIQYQIKGGTAGFKAADQQLNEVLAKHEGAAGELLLSVLAHAAYVKTQLGEVDAAIVLGERARATDPTYPSALFVLGRAYAQKGDLENAKKALEAAVPATEQRDSFFEPVVRAELAAVQARAGDEQNAIRNDEKVIDYDPRNIRAHFGLAAIFIKNEKYTQAMTIMRRALSNDPHWERDRLVPTDFPLPKADLGLFADAFRDAKTPKDDESLLSLKYSSEGMIRYHAGEAQKAESLFLQALKVDRYNHAALLYLAVMDLEKGQFVEPKRRLKVAVDTTAASHPVTRLYLARAELAAGDVESARKRLQDLVETEPTLVQARYSLAMVLRAQKLEAQATTELKTVVRTDPDFLPAKEALAEKL